VISENCIAAMTEYLLIKVNTSNDVTMKNLRGFLSNSNAEVDSFISEDIAKKILPTIDKLVDEEMKLMAVSECDHEEINETGEDNKDSGDTNDEFYLESVCAARPHDSEKFDESEAMRKFDMIGDECDEPDILSDTNMNERLLSLSAYDSAISPYKGLILDAFRVVTARPTGLDGYTSLLISSDIMINQMKKIRKLCMDGNYGNSLKEITYKTSYFTDSDIVEIPHYHFQPAFNNWVIDFIPCGNVGIDNIFGGNPACSGVKAVSRKMIGTEVSCIQDSLVTFHIHNLSYIDDYPKKKPKNYYAFNSVVVNIPSESFIVESFDGITLADVHDHRLMPVDMTAGLNPEPDLGSEFSELIYEDLITSPADNFNPNVYLSCPLFILLLYLIDLAIQVLSVHNLTNIIVNLKRASAVMLSTKRPVKFLSKYLFIVFYMTYQFNILDTFYHFQISGYDLHNFARNRGMSIDCFDIVSEYAGNIYNNFYMTSGKFKSTFRNIMYTIGMDSPVLNYIMLASINHVGGKCFHYIDVGLNFSDIIFSAKLTLIFTTVRNRDIKFHKYSPNRIGAKRSSLSITASPPVKTSIVSKVFRDIIAERIKNLGKISSKYG